MNQLAKQLPIIIIGNGIAGTTLARQVRKGSKQPIVIISEESDYFFSRTALMYVYMGHLLWEDILPYEKSFWKKNELELISDSVVDVATKEKIITLKSGKKMAYDKLVLATGSKPRRIPMEGDDFEGVQYFYHKKDLELLEKNTLNSKKAVLIGGGLIGIEMAEMLRSKNIEVTFLVRETQFWNQVLSPEESQLVGEHMKTHQIDLRLNTTLKHIESNAEGKVEAVFTDEGERIPCDFVGITIGVVPNIDFLLKTPIATEQGILVDEYLATNEKDVYAIGDCAQLRFPPKGRKAIDPIWYTGRMMGETLAQNLLEKPTKYAPGHAFNSSKFFDIEYQTYGQIQNIPSEEEAHFFWKKKTKSLRLAYSKKNHRFLGISVLGIRIRHEVIAQWLDEKITVDHVIDTLEKANFDPEFFPAYETEIQKLWKTSKTECA